MEELIEPAPSPRHHDAKKRTYIDQLLSYLTPRAQTILRLRYGLYFDDDERPRSKPEIAAFLGTSDANVSRALIDSMTRLRALANGAASLVRRKGKLSIWMGKQRGIKVTDLPVQETEEKPVRYELVGV